MVNQKIIIIVVVICIIILCSSSSIGIGFYSMSGTTTPPPQRVKNCNVSPSQRVPFELSVQWVPKLSNSANIANQKKECEGFNKCFDASTPKTAWCFEPRQD